MRVTLKAAGLVALVGERWTLHLGVRAKYRQRGVSRNWHYFDTGVAHAFGLGPLMLFIWETDDELGDVDG